MSMKSKNSDEEETPEITKQIEGLMLGLKADLEDKVKEIEAFIAMLRKLQ